MARKKTGKAVKSEIIQVRMTPKLRLAAEIGAISESRSLANLIEFAVEAYTKQLKLNVIHKWDKAQTAHGAADLIYDPVEPDCFVNRAIWFPEFLTPLEQRLWKLITLHAPEKTFKWGVQKIDPPEDAEELMKRIAKDSQIDMTFVRENWDRLKGFAESGEDLTAFKA